MLSVLLVAGLAAAQAPPMVVEASGQASIPCPVVESGAGAETSGCDDKSPRIEVTSGSPILRKAPRAAPAVRAEPPSRLRLETTAVYAREWDQPVRISLDTTPDRAYGDMQALQAVAARLDARALTWRYAEE